MKNLLLIILLQFPILLFSQQWAQSISENSIKKGEPTFYEVQKAFNDYYNPLGVTQGKMEINGKMEKIPGWKQYKRWEWFWEMRVNPTTGEFPSGEVYDNYFKQRASKSAKTTIGNWTSMGPKSSTGGYAGIGRINCVAFHPSDKNIFWVGAPSGGLWKTTDGGLNWTVLTDKNTVLGVSDIVIPSDYATSKTIYIATGDKDGGSMWSLSGGGSSDNSSIGVLKSTDDGTTWVTTGLTYTVSQGYRIGRLLVHPTNDNILFAATSEGIKKTADGGVSWTTAYSYSRQYYRDGIIDMEFKPGDPSVMYASTKEWGLAPKILMSSNTGSTWATIQDFAEADYRVEIAVTPDDPDYIYALIANENSGLSGIYRSLDGGTSFVQLVDGDDTDKGYLGYYSDGSGGNKGQGGYDLCIAASPSDKNVVLVGGINTWKTTDGGTNWNICNMWTSYNGYNFTGAPVVHADKHALAYRTDGTLFEGNDGGIYKSTDDGLSWTDISNNLVISQIYRLGVAQTDADMVVNGLQDNGSKIVDGGIWTDVTGGDGMECIIDYSDKNIQYSTYVHGEIYRTTDLWANYTTISNNISINPIDEGSGAWVTPYILDKNNSSIIYVGYADVWKSTDKGDSFIKISTINATEDLRSMAIAPSNSNYLYVGEQTKLWKTTNGGTAWSDITGTLPITDNNITYIAVKGDDPLTVWVTMGGYNTQSVYETTNGGTTWSNISTGLPSLPAMTIVQNTSVTSKVHLYVGTDVGVYFKNGSENWVLFSEGLPNVVVTELEIYYDAVAANSKLRAATFGRGLWESDLYKDPTVAPVANFSASSTTIQVGGTITFTDISENEPTSWAWTFTGGTPSTSTDNNAQVTYSTEGTYDVVLTVSNEIGNDTETKVGYITVNPPITPVAAFKANTTAPYVGQEVSFTDASTNVPTSWLWTMPGATPSTSTEQNPSVTYSAVGTYDVSLEATNSTGSNTDVKVGYISVKETTAFPEPSNVVATALKHDVTLNWDIPIAETIMEEGFEGTWPPTDWLVKHSTTIDGTQVDPTGTTWVHCDASTFGDGGEIYIHTGTYSAALGYDAPQFNWLISPEMVPMASTKLSFWLWYLNDISQNFITKFHVMVFNEGVWSSLVDFGSSSANNEYAKPVVTSLAAYANKTIKLAFVYEYNDGYQLAIDDVFVGTTVGGYEVYRDAELVTTINDSTQTEYSDMGLDAGSYDYYLKAFYTNPEGISIESNHASVNVYGIANASFIAAPTSGALPLEVVFTNTSENADAFEWNFGDGNSSTDKNSIHIYSEKGIYTVSLTASNAENSDTEVKTDYINVSLAPAVAKFSASPSTGVFPLEVTFTNNSENATNYNWTFGDTGTSSEQSPVHTYNEAGDYTVSLAVWNSDFQDTLTKANYISVVWPTPVADFDAAPITGVDPLTVEFTDKSENAQTWQWDFGDGTNSIDQSPSHTFLKGTYSISLLITNPTGNNSIEKQNLIVVDPNSLPESYKHKLKVFPNPASDFIAIELLNENYKEVEIELYDSQGKLVDTFIPNISELIKHQINIGSMQAGSYVLRIKIDADILVMSIIKE